LKAPPRLTVSWLKSTIWDIPFFTSTFHAGNFSEPLNFRDFIRVGTYARSTEKQRGWCAEGTGRRERGECEIRENYLWRYDTNNKNHKHSDPWLSPFARILEALGPAEMRFVSLRKTSGISPPPSRGCHVILREWVVRKSTRTRRRRCVVRTSISRVYAASIAACNSGDMSAIVLTPSVIRRPFPWKGLYRSRGRNHDGRDLPLQRYKRTIKSNNHREQPIQHRILQQYY